MQETNSRYYEVSGSEKAGRVASIRRLELWIVALAIGHIVIVPLVIQPNPWFMDPSIVLFLPKMKLLMGLSAALMVALLGFALLGGRFGRVPVLVPALAFLGVSVISTLFSGHILDSLIGSWLRFDGLLSLAAGVLLFYTAAWFVDSWAKVRVFLVSGVTTAVLISCHGILQIFGADPISRLDIAWPDSTDRAFSTIGYYLPLAAYLTLMAGAALALYFRSGTRWERWLWLAAVAVMSAAWLYTYTRGAVLGVAVAVLIVSFLAYRRFGRVKPLLLPIAVVVVALVSAQLLSPQSAHLLNRFGAANLAETPEEIPEGGDLSVMTRLLMWRDTVPVILERPLLGHGPDNFTEPFKRHAGEDLRAFFPDGTVIDKAHNEFLQVAATTGLLGLAVYLWVFISYFRNAYRSGGWPLLALAGSVLAYILQLQTAFTTIATGVTFWAILGVSVAIMRLRERDGEPFG